MAVSGTQPHTHQTINTYDGNPHVSLAALALFPLCKARPGVSACLSVQEAQTLEEWHNECQHGHVSL